MEALWTLYKHPFLDFYAWCLILIYVVVKCKQSQKGGNVWGDYDRKADRQECIIH